MSNLSKKILAWSVFAFFFTFPVTGFESLIVETGDGKSASRAFTLELAKNWEGKYLDSAQQITPENSGDFAKRFDNLNKGYSRFVIAPIYFLTPEELKNSQVKLVSTLWEVYVAPISDHPADSIVKKNKFKYWMSSPNSLVMQYLMNGIPPQPFGTEENYSEEVIVDENGMIVETAPSQSSAVMDQLIAVAPQQSHLVPSVYSDFVLFYDMVGSVKNLFKSHDIQLNLLSLGEKTISSFLKNSAWLRSITINVPGQSSIKTVGFQMGLFCKADEDSKTVKNILDILKKPLISSYIMKYTTPKQTSRLSDNILHSESIRFFK